ncbi:hypothetical protein DL770_007119 [Monosporascus sp. CRB-9-2]|nr:hypothetical protein DL770_007119 [Monosporascus sp. CRB-9-2]
MAHKRHQKAVDYETGHVIGYCRWILPDRLTGEWLEAQTPAVRSDKEKEYAGPFDNADFEYGAELDALDVPVVSLQNRRLELDYLAVHPDNKGHGIATLLAESGIAQAEQTGVNIFVLALRQHWASTNGLAPKCQANSCKTTPNMAARASMERTS